MTENEKLTGLVKEYFEAEDRLSPSSATAMGIHEYDSMLEDFSPDGITEMKNNQKNFAGRLNGIGFEELGREGKIKYHLLNERMKSSHRLLHETKPFEKDPAFYSELSLQSIFLLLLRDFAPLEERLESAAARLDKLPGLFDAAKKNLKNPPEIFTKIAVEMLEGADAFLQGLIPKMAEKAPKVRERILKSKDAARAAYYDYKKYLLEDVGPRSNGDFALGKELFDTMLTETEFLDYDSDALWEIGQRELEKCENEVIDFAKKNYDPDKPWRDVFKKIKYNHPPAKDVIKTYVEYLEKAKNFVEEHDVVTIPENQRLLAMETPEFNRSMTPFAAMMPPAPFEDDQTSFLWVTPVDMKQSPEAREGQLREHSYGKIQYVSLHEAYPGHHLQLVYSSMVKDPLFKRTFSNIFIEGWAFYCEQMMKEMNYFDTDGEFCQLEAAYWRALRILLDVGLHTGKFDFDGAYEFLQSKVEWAPFIAKGELKRYTRMPGQALSYYTGKLEIFRIKEAYQKAKGSEFSLRKFHEDILGCGSLPPKLIEWKLGIREIDRPVNTVTVS